MTLSDITLKKYGLVDGPFGSNLPASDYTSEGIPVIRGTNLSIGKYRFKDGNYVYVSKETAKRLHRCGCTPDDIIFTKKGTIGQVGIVPQTSKFKEFILSSNQMRLRLDKNVADPLFTYYYLSSPRISQKIIMEAMTTGVPKINLGYLKKFQIFFPPLPIQIEIASILSFYDALIENNKQRLKLLEEMAEEIYKEWFLRLRFPGYETAKFFNEEGKEVKHGMIGGLPEGWHKVKIGNAYSILGGGTPPTEIIEFWKDGSINWFSPTDITGSKSIFLNSSTKQITEIGLKNSSAKLFPEKSVMMTSRATIGAVGINLTKACTNQGFIICIPNENFPYQYIYEWIIANRNLIESYSTGATFKEISRGVFKNLDILKPSICIIKKFTELVEPIFEENQILNAKNQLLQQTRDLLLPRLISGKLSVEHLVEEVVHLPMAAEPEVKYKEQ